LDKINRSQIFNYLFLNKFLFFSAGQGDAHPLDSTSLHCITPAAGSLQLTRNNL
jgi:hypothetical protein